MPGQTENCDEAGRQLECRGSGEISSECLIFIEEVDTSLSHGVFHRVSKSSPLNPRRRHGR
jgi:hypothetical protein